MKKFKKSSLAGLILAGGKSRRMNLFDKSQKKLCNETLLERQIKKVSKQLDTIIINSNSNYIKKQYKKFPVLEDLIPGNLGPLAGIYTGLEWLQRKNKDVKWLFTFPIDSPFFPDDIVETFLKNYTDEKIIIAKSGFNIHPVFAMWHIDIMKGLESSLRKKILKIDVFTKKFKFKVVNFPIFDYDPFFNINNELDLLNAEKIQKTLNKRGANKL